MNRVTIPALSSYKKSLVIILRSVALILLLLLIFEPVVSYSKKVELIPKNLVFIDNSRSIKINDQTNRQNAVKSILSDFLTSPNDFSFQTFGGKVKPISVDSLDNILFNEGTSNFEKIFNHLDVDVENITSVTIISDGGINDGNSPIFQAEKLGVPTFTIGVGDTSTLNDAEVKNILTNNFIYSETPTQVLTTISNYNLSGIATTLSLYENEKLIEQKFIVLSEEGLQTERFNYTPHAPGEKKITITIGKTANEFSEANNKKISYINVLDEKVEALLIAGSPSADLSFLKTVLLSDKNINVNTITQLSDDKFLEAHNRAKLIDSADILFLIGFPARNTPTALIKDVLSKIKNDKKPFYFLLSKSTDLTKLEALESILPFSIKKNGNDPIEIQPNLQLREANNVLIRIEGEDVISEWNNLPPVFQHNAEFIAKPESEVIVNSRINNIPISNPLIISSSFVNRSVAVLAQDIWKWKLQSSEKSKELYDKFILNSVRWLNTDEQQKKVIIKTNKKIYSLGEDIEFTAQVYDQSFNAVNNASVEIKISNSKMNDEIKLLPVGSGLYEGHFSSIEHGDFSFLGKAYSNGTALGENHGTFNVGEIDLEATAFRMNRDFLRSLSIQGGGEFYLYSNYKSIFEKIKTLTAQSSKEKEIKHELALWSNEWLLILIIISLAIEWLLRKLWGLL